MRSRPGWPSTPLDQLRRRLRSGSGGGGIGTTMIPVGAGRAPAGGAGAGSGARAAMVGAVGTGGATAGDRGVAGGDDAAVMLDEVGKRRGAELWAEARRMAGIQSPDDEDGARVSSRGPRDTTVVRRGFGGSRTPQL